jgi:hypothetical protein
MTVRLRRPLYARLFSSGLQALLTVYTAVTVGFVVAAVAGSFDWAYWYVFVFDVVVVGVWLLGVTAWAEVDDRGIRWRYWMKHDYPWGDVSRVALGQRAMSPMFPGPDVRQPVILVRCKGDEDFVRPAVLCRRHRREFGNALLQQATAHRKHTEVIGKHWDLQPTTDEMPFA